MQEGDSVNKGYKTRLIKNAGKHAKKDQLVRDGESRIQLGWTLQIHALCPLVVLGCHQNVKKIKRTQHNIYKRKHIKIAHDYPANTKKMKMRTIAQPKKPKKANAWFNYLSAQRTKKT